MFNNLPRHTLIRKTNGGVFLIKCKIYQFLGGKDCPCYIGHLYSDNGVDYEPATCYINDIECVLEEPNYAMEVQ
jgi:hypothetical protein